jgi:hypothetical protein
MRRTPVNIGQRCRACHRQNATKCYGRAGKSKVFAYGVESQRAVIAVFFVRIAGLRTSTTTMPGKLEFLGQSDHCTECAIGAERVFFLTIGCVMTAKGRALRIFRRIGT